MLPLGSRFAGMTAERVYVWLSSLRYRFGVRSSIWSPGPNRAFGAVAHPAFAGMTMEGVVLWLTVFAE